MQPAHYLALDPHFLAAQPEHGKYPHIWDPCPPTVWTRHYQGGNGYVLVTRTGGDPKSRCRHPSHRRGPCRAVTSPWFLSVSLVGRLLKDAIPPPNDLGSDANLSAHMRLTALCRLFPIPAIGHAWVHHRIIPIQPRPPVCWMQMPERERE